MIFFELVKSLTRSFVLARIDPEISETLNTEKHVQWQAGQVTITISELASESSLITFVTKPKTHAVTVNASELGIYAKTEISPEIQLKFDHLIVSELGGNLPPRQDESKSANQISHQNSRENSQEKKTNLFGRPKIGVPIRPRPNDMPKFDDEYEVHGGKSQGLLTTTSVPIGDRDINPPGLPRDPLMKPYIDPLAVNPDGGMYPGGDHPIFGRNQRNTSRLGVPPGARFDDPYGEDNLDDMGSGLPGNLRQNDHPHDLGGFGGVGGRKSGGPGGFGGGFGSSFGF